MYICFLCIYYFVITYVCICVFVYVSAFLYNYVIIYERKNVLNFVFMYLRIFNICMYICRYVRMYVYIYVCIYVVCVYLCMCEYIYLCIFVYMCACKGFCIFVCMYVTLYVWGKLVFFRVCISWISVNFFVESERKNMARRFDLLNRNTRQYSWYNAVGRQIAARLTPPSDNCDPVTHFLGSVNDLFGYVLHDVDDGDMVGITIRNQVKQNDKPVGISFRRKDQLSADVIWSVFEKGSQSNSRFKALDTLVVNVNSVRMPSGFGKHSLKSMGRLLSMMAHLKKKYRGSENRGKLSCTCLGNSCREGGERSEL